MPPNLRLKKFELRGLDSSQQVQDVFWRIYSKRRDFFLGSSRASPNLGLKKSKKKNHYRKFKDVPEFGPKVVLRGAISSWEVQSLLRKFKGVPEFAVKKPKSFKDVPELHFAKNGRSNFKGVAWETEGV